MNLVETIRAKARSKGATIVLPEGTEERTVKAAGILTREKLPKLSS